MSFNINNSQGILLTVVEDGTINVDTSIALFGNATPDFGERLNENLVKLLENFASFTAPANAQEGQLWYDKTNERVQIYKSTGWQMVLDASDELPPISSGTSFPGSPVLGQLFWRTTNDSWWVYDTSGWVQLFPPLSSSTPRIQNAAGTEYADTALNPNEVSFGADSSNKLTVTSLNTTSVVPLTVSSGFFVNGVGKYLSQQGFNASQPSATLNNANATISWDLDTAQVAKLILNNNKTLSAPINRKNGGTYILFVQQDGVGGRSIAYDSVFKFPSATIPELSTDPFGITVISFVSDGTNMYGS